MNDDGERLGDFYEDIKPRSSRTPHRKNIHKFTSTSPKEAVKSQIDHILINGKRKSSLPDVKDYRGADVVSVHTLVIRVFSEKLLKTRMQIASWPQYQQKSNDTFRNDGGSVKYQKRNAICKENQKLTK